MSGHDSDGAEYRLVGLRDCGGGEDGKSEDAEMGAGGAGEPGLEDIGRIASTLR